MSIIDYAEPGSDLDTERLLARVTGLTAPLQPFSPQVVELLAEFAQRLSRLSESRTYPELQALAFWLRRSQLVRLHQQFQALQGESLRLVPRGLVLHLNPANVETLFVYTWALALLTGNRNLVRVSRRQGPVSRVLLTLLGQLVRDNPWLSGNTLFLSYPHDQNAALSTLCDVRMMWGGDHTVRALRAEPAPIHVRDVVFHNRYSGCVIHTEAYGAATAQQKQELAVHFYNDAYGFDQMGCSSPRFVIWCGHQPADSEIFYDHLRRVVKERGYALDTSLRMQKTLFTHQAILDQDVTAWREFGPEITVLRLGSGPIPAAHCGGGLFFEKFLETLPDVLPLCQRPLQTLTHFGFCAQERQSLVTLLNGRGVDRLVEVGKALEFGRFWDGYDLLQELSRYVAC